MHVSAMNAEQKCSHYEGCLRDIFAVARADKTISFSALSQINKLIIVDAGVLPHPKDDPFKGDDEE